MALTRTISIPVKDHIREALLRDMSTGRLATGSRLDPIRALAQRFDTSVRTVHLALNQLEAQGRLVKRHGSGTFVAECDPELTLADSVVLCMEITGHVFADLCRMIQHDLARHEQVPMCLDVNHPEFARLLRRASFSQADFFVVHGSRYFPFDQLRTKPFANKAIVGILDWEDETLIDRAHRVIVDHCEGGRTAARHLQAAGHRKALLVGNGQMLWFVKHEGSKFPNSGHGFVEAWEEQGNAVEWCQVLEGGGAVEGPEADGLLAMLSAPEAPTAIHALMDTNAAWVQNVLLARAPELAKRVDIVGYGNTPWSQAARPAFSSVDWNLESVVKETSAIINAVQAGQLTEPRVVKVMPVLVRR